MAHNGTIFLDEISGMPLELQAHLLRVIQEREVVRLGGEKVTPVDVRILAATNKDLLREIECGNFREDLYYRLCVLVLEIPPLRARVRDVRPLAGQFVKEYAVRYDRAVRAITDEALRVLETMHFPGNIRELSATIERAVILCRKDTIDAEELERVLFGMRDRQPADAPAPDAALPARNAFERAELQILRDTLAEHRGNRARAAAALGIGRTTLWRKMTHYGIIPIPD